MKILIVSDVHNQWNMLAEAIELGHTEGCTTLLFAGDAHEPHIYAELSAFKGDIHTVWGNNDVPHFVFQAALLLKPRITNHGDFMDIILDGKRFFMSHYPNEVAATLTKAPDVYNVLIHGHTHMRRDEHTGTAHIINPGECCGTRYGTPSAALFDTESMKVTFLTLSHA
ncbi:MAG: hypothetical protein RI911_533 [Candidatus Parcubacteria bacterium]|jgi:putative phosphoesterase